MLISPAPDLSDPAFQLPADAYYELVRTLRLTLPPPPGDHPSPEDLARRDRAAIARVAALCPANAAEADLAAMFVAASEQWKDCLRLAQAPETLPRAPTRGTPNWAMKCRAQALSMMRQANAALRLLLRMQEARRKLEGDPAACNSLAWAEHCAAGLMTEALRPSPPPLGAESGPNSRSELASRQGELGDTRLPLARRDPSLRPRPASGGGDFALPGICADPLGCTPEEGTAVQPAPPQPSEQAAAASAPAAGRPANNSAGTPCPRLAKSGVRAGLGPAEPGSDLGPAEAAADPLAEAEQYALLYPQRAALIRRLGRLPDDVSFGPPDDEIVQALIAGDTPALAALDGYPLRDSIWMPETRAA